MNKVVFRSHLVRDKGFLKTLYEGENKVKNNRILSVANDSKLDTLIVLLHFITNGDIKIKKENFEVMRDHKKLNVLRRHVEKKSSVNVLLQSERIDKLKFLKQFSAIYSSILYCLFNET